MKSDSTRRRVHSNEGFEAALTASCEAGAPLWIHMTSRQPLEWLVAWFETRDQNTERIMNWQMDHESRSLGLPRRALGMGITIKLTGSGCRRGPKVRSITRRKAPIGSRTSSGSQKASR